MFAVYFSGTSFQCLNPVSGAATQVQPDGHRHDPEVNSLLRSLPLFFLRTGNRHNGGCRVHTAIPRPLSSLICPAAGPPAVIHSVAAAGGTTRCDWQLLFVEFR